MSSLVRIQREIPIQAPYWSSIPNQERQLRLVLPELPEEKQGRIVQFSASILPFDALMAVTPETRPPSFHVHLQDANVPSNEMKFPGQIGFVDMLIFQFNYINDVSNGTIYGLVENRPVNSYTVARAPIMPEKPVIHMAFPYNFENASVYIDILMRVETVDKLERIVQLYSGNS
jgi:hypothetical protein